MTWRIFEQQNPEMAEFGAARLNGQVAYLATTRADGSPRVHPMTPIIGDGHFFVFMEPTSPKGKDLLRDPRHAIHCSVSGNTGESGEIILTGRAHLVEDAALREVAARASSYKPAPRYILFEFEIESADTCVYPEGKPARQHWRKQETSTEKA